MIAEWSSGVAIRSREARDETSLLSMPRDRRAFRNQIYMRIIVTWYGDNNNYNNNLTCACGTNRNCCGRVTLLAEFYPSFTLSRTVSSKGGTAACSSTTSVYCSIVMINKQGASVPWRKSSVSWNGTLSPYIIWMFHDRIAKINPHHSTVVSFLY